MVVIHSPNERLDELFVRYWDGILTDAEAQELEHLLATDPESRDCFQLLCLQAVAAADLPAASARTRVWPRSLRLEVGPRPARWSRRRVLGYVGGIAASIAAGVLGWRHWSRPAPLPVRLTSTGGAVTVATASGEKVAQPVFVPPGGTLATFGPVSRALLRFADGADISLNGDSVATLADDGRRLVLRQGNATATVPSLTTAAAPLTLATAQAVLSRLTGVVITLGCVLQRTDVGVQHGVVEVASPSGESWGEVQEGELLTVFGDGIHRKQRMPPTPDQLTWDIERSRPTGWHVGKVEKTPDGAVVRPELWLDPYYQTQMYQIRSDSQWVPALFRLVPESVIRVRYWVEEPGPSQVVICVRTERPGNPASGVVECNDAFAKARPRQWQWLEVPVKDMLDNRHAPKFAAPWVGFLLIFNTYKKDLGLRIGEFRVTRPGRPAAGS
jgi:hypothetical protein